MDTSSNITNATQPWRTPGTCDCARLGELRTAVTILAVMLGTMIATTIALTVFKSNTWRRQAEAAKQAEIDELKKQNKEYEEKWKDFSWEKFFKDGSVRDPGVPPDLKTGMTWVEYLEWDRQYKLSLAHEARRAQGP